MSDEEKINYEKLEKIVNEAISDIAKKTAEKSKTSAAAFAKSARDKGRRMRGAGAYDKDNPVSTDPFAAAKAAYKGKKAPIDTHDYLDDGNLEAQGKRLSSVVKFLASDKLNFDDSGKQRRLVGITRQLKQIESELRELVPTMFDN